MECSINQGKKVVTACAIIHPQNKNPEPHPKVNNPWCLVTHRACFSILFLLFLITIKRMANRFRRGNGLVETPKKR